MQRVHACRQVILALVTYTTSLAAQAPVDTLLWRPLAPDVISGSPDGRFVVVRDPATQFIALRETATGRTTALIDSLVRWPAFAWSPDSRSLAFSYGGSLFVYSVATGARRLHPSAGEIRGWTRTDELFVRSGPASYLVAADGGTALREVARGVREHAVTADGESLILQTRRTAPLVVRNLRTGVERRLTSLSDVAEYGATISQDGRLVLFIANRAGDFGLYVVPLAGLAPITPLRLMDLTSLEARSDILVAWWLDDGSVAVAHTIAALNSHLYRVDVDPKTGTALDVPRRITTGNVWDVGPAVSPESKRVAFSRYPGAAILDSPTSEVRTVSDSGYPNGWYSATQILLDSVAGGRLHIAALDVTTGRRTHIAALEAAARGYAPWKFMAATQEIVYFSADSGNAGGLRVFNPRSGTTRRVVAATGLRMLLAAPDGRRVVYTTGTELRLVALVPAGDSTTTVLSAGGRDFPLAWAPDSRRLLYLDLNQQSLHVLDVGTRSRHALLPRSDQMLTYSSVYNYANATWSPDGTYILLNGQFLEQAVGRRWLGVTPEAVGRLMAR